MNNHSNLVNEILLLCGSRRDCRIWQNNTGAAQIGNRYIRYGKVGSPDIIGFTSDGKFLGFECKTGKAVKSKPQIVFHKIATRYGCRVITVNHASEAVAFLDGLNLDKINLTLDF